MEGQATPVGCNSRRLKEGPGPGRPGTEPVPRDLPRQDRLTDGGEEAAVPRPSPARHAVARPDPLPESDGPPNQQQ